MEIQEKNIIAAYKVADGSGQQLLRALFPAVEFDKQEVDNRPVTERIKTFDNALEALGEDNPYVSMYRTIACNYHEDKVTAAMFAYAKLQVVCAALNEGWEPKFVKGECRYFPWFYLYTKEQYDRLDDEKKRHCVLRSGNSTNSYYGFGLCYAHYGASGSHHSCYGSRLLFRTHELAAYAGAQFADLWADFYLIRK